MVTSKNSDSGNQELLNTKEMAKRIGISAYTLQKWVREKKIPAYSPSSKIYLFDPQEVISQIKKNRAS